MPWPEREEARLIRWLFTMGAVLLLMTVIVKGCRPAPAPIMWSWDTSALPDGKAVTGGCVDVKTMPVEPAARP